MATKRGKQGGNEEKRTRREKNLSLNRVRGIGCEKKNPEGFEKRKLEDVVENHYFFGSNCEKELNNQNHTGSKV